MVRLRSAIFALGIAAPVASRTAPAMVAVVAESCPFIESGVTASRSPAKARVITRKADRKLIHQLDLLRIGKLDLSLAVIVNEFS